jgi:hypothetical protein
MRWSAHFGEALRKRRQIGEGLVDVEQQDPWLLAPVRLVVLVVPLGVGMCCDGELLSGPLSTLNDVAIESYQQASPALGTRTMKASRACDGRRAANRCAALTPLPCPASCAVAGW